MGRSKEEIERAIQNARATMEMEGFTISDELMDFMRSDPSEEEIRQYIEAMCEKYRQGKEGD